VDLTIDELAGVVGATTRSIRSFQSKGLVDPPSLRGRTGLYDAHHRNRLETILRLQAEGFTLQSIGALFRAHARGEPLAALLGITSRDHTASTDPAELYGFSDLRALGTSRPGSRRRRPLLAVVPTTVWDQREVSVGSVQSA
jgi:DNA-binding transcriptional MerR regulator